MPEDIPRHGTARFITGAPVRKDKYLRVDGNGRVIETHDQDENAVGVALHDAADSGMIVLARLRDDPVAPGDDVVVVAEADGKLHVRKAATMGRSTNPLELIVMRAIGREEAKRAEVRALCAEMRRAAVEATEPDIGEMVTGARGDSAAYGPSALEAAWPVYKMLSPKAPAGARVSLRDLFNDTASKVGRQHRAAVERGLERAFPARFA